MRETLARLLGGRVLPLRQRETAAQCYARGSRLAEAEDWPAAAEAFRAALALDDRNAEWHARLGSALAKAGDWTGAAEALRDAVERDPENAQRRYALGSALAKLKDWEGAAHAYEAALARDDTQAWWFVRLGAARGSMEDWAGAAEAYRAATLLEPDNPKWHYRLGIALGRLDDYTGAVDAYGAALALDPSDDLCRRRLAYFLGMAGRAAEVPALLSPLTCESDRRLQAFLDAQPEPVKRTEATLIHPVGSRTLLSRRIDVAHHDGKAAYFEQLKFDGVNSRRVSAFYQRLSDVLRDDLPAWIPYLHFTSSDDGYRYFLFEHHDGMVDPFAGAEGPLDERDMRRARHAVSCLTEISQRLGPVFDGDDQDAELKTPVFAPSEARFALEMHLQRHLADEIYSKSLLRLLERWDEHASRLGEMKRVFCHGDVHGENVIADNEGIVLLDWEAYGLGPVGYDLVWLFRGLLVEPQFAPLIDRYFDDLAPEIGADERRYIVALLGTVMFASRPTRLPQAWLDMLT